MASNAFLNSVVLVITYQVEASGEVFVRERLPFRSAYLHPVHRVARQGFPHFSGCGQVF
jgi:hypothetical protein